MSEGMPRQNLRTWAQPGNPRERVPAGQATAAHPAAKLQLNILSRSRPDVIGGNVLSHLRHLRICFLLSICLVPAATYSQSEASTKPTMPQRGGQRDFDFEFGAWKAHISRR